ncbi:MAG: hypothetical protein M3O22_03200 [Pseudomonadota bacterium]|nr:hypothetical protein [Pseudomonadota bacterium]
MKKTSGKTVSLVAALVLSCGVSVAGPLPALAQCQDFASCKAAVGVEQGRIAAAKINLVTGFAAVIKAFEMLRASSTVGAQLSAGQQQGVGMVSALQAKQNTDAENRAMLQVAAIEAQAESAEEHEPDIGICRAMNATRRLDAAEKITWAYGTAMNTKYETEKNTLVIKVGAPAVATAQAGAAVTLFGTPDLNPGGDPELVNANLDWFSIASAKTLRGKQLVAAESFADNLGYIVATPSAEALNNPRTGLPDFQRASSLNAMKSVGQFPIKQFVAWSGGPGDEADGRISAKEEWMNYVRDTASPTPLAELARLGPTQVMHRNVQVMTMLLKIQDMNRENLQSQLHAAAALLLAMNAERDRMAGLLPGGSPGRAPGGRIALAGEKK